MIRKIMGRRPGKIRLAARLLCFFGGDTGVVESVCSQSVRDDRDKDSGRILGQKI